jgi:hypothetical protein
VGLISIGDPARKSPVETALPGGATQGDFFSGPARKATKEIDKPGLPATLQHRGFDAKAGAATLII